MEGVLSKNKSSGRVKGSSDGRALLRLACECETIVFHVHSSP